MTVVLASGSPRRRDLLTWAGVDVDVQPQDIDESRLPGEAPVAYAMRLAAEKASSALGVAGPDHVVVAADTVVHIAERVFDKPRDRIEARAHLEALSGREHRVTTGVCVARFGTPVLPFEVTTRVRMRTLSADEIEAYLATGEADDKAGAYAIQGIGGAMVSDVHGSWTNVMGLPLEQTLAALEIR